MTAVPMFSTVMVSVAETLTMASINKQLRRTVKTKNGDSLTRTSCTFFHQRLLVYSTAAETTRTSTPVGLLGLFMTTVVVKDNGC